MHQTFGKELPRLLEGPAGRLARVCQSQSPRLPSPFARSLAPCTSRPDANPATDRLNVELVADVLAAGVLFNHTARGWLRLPCCCLRSLDIGGSSGVPLCPPMWAARGARLPPPPSASLGILAATANVAGDTKARSRSSGSRAARSKAVPKLIPSLTSLACRRRASLS